MQHYPSRGGESFRRTVLLALALSLAACGPGPSGDGRFAAGAAAYPLSCLEHQPDAPGSAYTSEQGRDTAVIFTMMKYFTANKGVTNYCDGEGPSQTDRLWARLYIDLGAEPANVAHIVAGPA